MKKYELAIIIVNYRTPGLVLDCLSGLLAEKLGDSFRIVLVDNASDDGSADIIAAWLSVNDLDNQVSFVCSEVNSGFAGGNNVGIRSIAAQFYLLLNSDTLVRPGAIRTLIDKIVQYPAAGLVSPRLEWPDGTGQESCFRFHTPVSELIGASHTRVVDRLFQNFIVPLPVQVEVAYPSWTSFACVLIRAEVFEKIGYLDEGYFMYFEDVEFCHRARQAGWEIIHTPDAHVVHLRGGSSPVKNQARLKKRLSRYYYESRTRYFFQSYGWWGLTAANLMWWLGRSVSKTRQFLGRSDKTAVERQWLDIWTNWLNPLKPYTPPK